MFNAINGLGGLPGWPVADQAAFENAIREAKAASPPPPPPLKFSGDPRQVTEEIAQQFVWGSEQGPAPEDGLAQAIQALPAALRDASPITRRMIGVAEGQLANIHNMAPCTEVNLGPNVGLPGLGSSAPYALASDPEPITQAATGGTDSASGSGVVSDISQFGTGFGTGIWSGLKSMATGAVSLAKGSWQAATNPVATGQAIGNTASWIVNNPSSALAMAATIGKSLYDAAGQAIETAASNPEAAGELLGEGVTAAGGALIPGGAEGDAAEFFAESAQGLTLSTAESWGNARSLADHFARHGADFGATSEANYSGQASRFLQNSQANGFETNIDSSGTIRIYDPSTNSFGAFNADGTTRTFFKPSSPTYFDRQPGVPPTILGGP